MPRLTPMSRIAMRIAVLCVALLASRADAQSDSASADPSALGARARYRLTDLGTPSPTIEGVAITNSGELFGVFVDWPASPYSHRVFSWTPREGFVELGGYSGYAAYVTDVSRSGCVLGGARVGLGGSVVAFLWRPHGDLVTFASMFYESAVNNAGQVVGGTPASPIKHAFSWSDRGGMLDLGTLGGSGSFANALSDAGQVVGWSTLTEDEAPWGPPGPAHAFSWTARGGMIDLGTLGGYSTAWAVSNAGHVVGESETEVGGARHAFLWTPRDGMVDLGTLGGPNSHATGVSDSGAVIGVSDTADSAQHAFFWTRTSGMVDLGSVGGVDSSPIAINPTGVVIGSSGGHAFAWSQRTGLVDLGEGNAASINARGQIAGTVGGHVVIWEPAGPIE